jgi:hypothetical protein
MLPAVGQRAYCSVPPNGGKNTTTLLASMCVEGMGPSPLAVEGATDGEVFEAYDVEEVLALSLRSGQIVIMDNLSAHKGHRVRELIEERGWELL